ncbi:hypothetical protein [Nocardioides pantholopis]|nr:hypothetical protein [Nocardioides pantholopis]
MRVHPTGTAGWREPTEGEPVVKKLLVALVVAAVLGAVAKKVTDK